MQIKLNKIISLGIKTMSNELKIDIARHFVSKHNLHQFANLTDWMPTKQMKLAADKDQYLTIYHNLINGHYGNVRPTGFDNELEIEISGFDSNTGNSIIFNFDRV
jgi:hypothetical protein